MALTGKLGQMKYYLFKVLKETVKKKVNIADNYNSISGEEQSKFKEYLAQEKILVKILKDCFNLDVDTALIAMNLKKEEEL